MKTKIATIIVALTVISICLADSVGALSKSDKSPPATLQEVHTEVQEMRAKLEQALTRIAVLEKQVSSLQQANAKLESQVKNFGQPHLVPLEHK
jgi:peptidoglycan hydrolase CwlO-like protein